MDKVFVVKNRLILLCAVFILVGVLCVVLVVSESTNISSRLNTFDITVDTEFSNVKCKLKKIEVARDKGTMTAYFVFIASKSSRISGTCYPSGQCDPYDLSKSYLLVEGRRYEVATDDRGNPLASRIESPYAFPNIGPGKSIDVYVTFVAPQEKTRSVSIYLPNVDPFENVVISEISLVGVSFLYCGILGVVFVLGMLFESLLRSFSVDNLVTIVKKHRGKVFSIGLCLLISLFSFLYINSVISSWGFSVFMRLLATFILFGVIYVAYKRKIIQLSGALLATISIIAAIVWSFTLHS